MTASRQEPIIEETDAKQFAVRQTERGATVQMAKDVRIMTFYDELLQEVVSWICLQDDKKAAGQAKLLTDALSADRRNVPAESVEAILASLPAFVAANPTKRTPALHLQKYLESVLAAAEA